MSNDPCSVKGTVLRPDVSAWVEQVNSHAGIGIAAGEIRSLAMVASAASPSKILRSVITAMLLRDDVFDVKHRVRIRMLWQSTILAASAGPSSNEIARVPIHASARPAGSGGAGQ